MTPCCPAQRHDRSLEPRWNSIYTRVSAVANVLTLVELSGGVSVRRWFGCYPDRGYGALFAVSGPANARATCADVAVDVATAAAMAKSCDDRVEALSPRTQTSQTFMNPNGTSTIEQFSRPQRVQRANGGWSALDPTLVVNADGSLSPRASTADLVFSGGGVAEAGSVGCAGDVPRGTAGGGPGGQRDRDRVR